MSESEIKFNMPMVSSEKPKPVEVLRYGEWVSPYRFEIDRRYYTLIQACVEEANKQLRAERVQPIKWDVGYKLASISLAKNAMRRIDQGRALDRIMRDRTCKFCVLKNAWELEPATT